MPQTSAARRPRPSRSAAACPVRVRQQPGRTGGRMPPMELTKQGHACVVVTDGDRRLVIDPGAWTDPAVLDGATAVLVTHEHADHLAADRLHAALAADPAVGGGRARGARP